MGLGFIVVLGSLILYLRGMRIMMFQLSGFYCRVRRKGLSTLNVRPWLAEPGVFMLVPIVSGVVPFWGYLIGS